MGNIILISLLFQSLFLIYIVQAMSGIYFKEITSPLTLAATSSGCISSYILMENSKVLNTNNRDFIVLNVSDNLMKARNPVYRKICFK